MENQSGIQKILILLMSYIRVFLYRCSGKKVCIGRIALISPSSDIFCVGKNSQIIFGNHLRLYKRTTVKAEGGAIVFGEGVSVNPDSMIVAKEKINIGDHTLIGPGVKIFDHDHCFGCEQALREYSTKEIVIGKNVWIGASSIILKGTVIGDNSVIAAGRVVRGSVSADSMYYDKRTPYIKSLK